jgi:hypothetical protein
MAKRGKYHIVFKATCRMIPHKTACFNEYGALTLIMGAVFLVDVLHSKLFARTELPPPRALLACEAVNRFEATIQSHTPQGDIILSDAQRLNLAALNLTPIGMKALERDYPVGAHVRILLWQTHPDRWKRLIGDMERIDKDAPIPSAHERLLTQGEAFVRPHQSVPLLCMGDFKLIEKSARDKQLGVWSQSNALLYANQPDHILKHKGTYRVIEGVVASIGERRYVTYLNFGEHWTHDTTVSIPQKIWQNLQDQGLTKTSLKGKKVQFRGVIEERAGPLITLSHSEDLDVLDDQHPQLPQ